MDGNPYKSPSCDSISDDTEAVRQSKGSLGLAVAIVAGCLVQLIVWRRNYFGSSPPSLKALALVFDLSLGAAAGVGVHALCRAVMNRQFNRLMPGHWIAISTISYFIGMACSWWVDARAFFPWPRFAGDPQELVKALTGNFVGAAFFVAVGLCSRESRVWRIYAWLNVALFIGYLLRAPQVTDEHNQFAYENSPTAFANMALATTMLAMWAARLAFLVGLIQDVRWRIQRDLPHWLGLSLGTTNAMLPIVLTVIDVIAIG